MYVIKPRSAQIVKQKCWSPSKCQIVQPSFNSLYSHTKCTIVSQDNCNCLWQALSQAAWKSWSFQPTHSTAVGREESSPEDWQQVTHHHHAASEWVSCLPTTQIPIRIPQHRQWMQWVGNPLGPLNWLCALQCVCVCVVASLFYLHGTMTDMCPFRGHLYDTIDATCGDSLF